MHKEKIDILYKFINALTNRPWLKIVSLILAILAWMFVKGELSRPGL
jgi:hypothetical protein